jgi:hypothetical protein
VDLFQPAGVDLIWLSTSAPFTHENFERGYLGLKAATAALYIARSNAPGRISDASRLRGLAGSHRVFCESFLERGEFVGGEACHDPPVDSYTGRGTRQ